jgi:ribose transport system substrate-binding protein
VSRSRIIATASAVVAITTIAAGCSSSSGSSGSTSTGGSTGSTAAAKSGTVTFIQGVAGDPFYQTMACGAEAEAKAIGVKLNVQGATNWDVSLQTPIVQSVIAAKPDVMFIAPNDATAMIAPLKQAVAAGIKVGTVDTSITDTSVPSFSISTDNVAGGAAAADALAKLVGEKGSVLLVGEQPGVTTAVQRGQGFRDELKKYPNIKYVGNIFTNASGVSSIAALVSSKIAATPDLVGIFALATDQSEGANNAVRAAGKAGKIKVVGFDAGPTQVEQLKQGVVQALVAQQPAEIGKDAVDDASALINGKSVEAHTGTGSAVVTADNMNDPAYSKYLYKTTC